MSSTLRKLVCEICACQPSSTLWRIDFGSLPKYWINVRLKHVETVAAIESAGNFLQVVLRVWEMHR